MMRLFCFCALACALLFAPAAHAQFAVYAEGQAVRFDNQVNATTDWFTGGTFGAYYDFARIPVLALGLDARGSFLSGDQQHFRSGMVGLRADARTPALPFRPYVEGLIGVGGTKADVTSNLPLHYSNKFEYEVLGGLDFTVFPHLDVRLPEIGYARMSPVSSSSTSPDSRLLELSAGLVLRLF